MSEREREGISVGGGCFRSVISHITCWHAAVRISRRLEGLDQVKKREVLTFERPDLLVIALSIGPGHWTSHPSESCLLRSCNARVFL